jgi:hypothetical protein
MRGLFKNAWMQGPLHRIAKRGSYEELSGWGIHFFSDPLFLTSALPIFACPKLKAGTRYKKGFRRPEEKEERMDVFTAISGRRSCRKFHPEAVSDADIEKILEAGNWAPSPANQQPWEFIVITSTGIKERIFSESEVMRSSSPSTS